MLDQLGLSHVKQPFRDNGVNGSLLVALDETVRPCSYLIIANFCICSLSPCSGIFSCSLMILMSTTQLVSTMNGSLRTGVDGAAALSIMPPVALVFGFEVLQLFATAELFAELTPRLNTVKVATIAAC